MNEFYNCLDKFNKQIEEILLYLELLELQKNFIAEFENNMHNENSSIYVQKLSKIQNSTVQYNALIISIYGCFEEFVNNIAEIYIKNICSFTDEMKFLPINITQKYLNRLSEYLSNPNRFRRFGLDRDKVLENFYDLFNPSTQISFGKNICFLLNHSGNLTNKQVIEFSNEIGIKINFNSFIDNSYFKKYLKDKFQYDDSQINVFRRKKIEENTIFLQLDTLVNERNKVAHGWTIYERISYSVIKDDIISFLKVYGQTLLEIYIENLINYLFRNKLQFTNKLQFIKLGNIIDIFNNNILCVNNGENLFKVGDFIIAVSKDETVKNVFRIKSLQINKKNINEITEKNVDVGIGFENDKRIKKQWSCTLLNFNLLFKEEHP